MALKQFEKVQLSEMNFSDPRIYQQQIFKKNKCFLDNYIM